jgi:hypothetical protein
MVWQFWLKVLDRNPHAKWTDLRIWKMDLRGAYTLICFGPDDAGLFGMLLPEDLVYLQIAGIFGWAGTPAAFQVVTRAIICALRHALQSDVLMYVDDIMEVGMAEHVPTDIALTRAICTSLLGPTSVADDKTEQGRRLDVIGYVIDLDTQRVSISRKNPLSAIHGFITVDINRFDDTARRAEACIPGQPVRQDMQSHALLLRGTQSAHRRSHVSTCLLPDT